MSREELLRIAKLRLRKRSNDALDDDVSQLVETALADLERIGVHETWLQNPDPMIKEAVLGYVKANYSINEQYGLLIGCYQSTLTKIKGSSKYFSAKGGE